MRAEEFAAMDQPPVPVPGLPDSTPKLISLEFTKKATPFRLSEACARGTMIASAAVLAAQREQIRLYAFGGDPANPPRPACTGQPRGFTRLDPDPPLAR
ncbi:MAG TPA: hypothetical protein VGW14_06655 [Thermoleophilaceae bacterium]|nr:hypothetical protein [Thermoleophilaceae bacterium]